MTLSPRSLRVLILAGALLAIRLALPLAAQEVQPNFEDPKGEKKKKEEDKTEKKPKPITADRGPIGKLLEKWAAEGTAAGNTGDLYDNRDREHSELNRQPYPQLEKWQYTPVELEQRQDWALFGGVRPGIVFGNSSTSAGAYQGGSNPRRAYMHPRGLEVLYRQYRGNNLYIYPEHRDHDPGHNGANDGYGDLYPTNTPFVLISQGSSGSDQPFMRAVPFTLAAFRPEVKKRLAENGLLMPTVQMILRISSKRLASPQEYLTGKAHPTVFEGAWVNDLKMVEMAHEITLEDLPPIALLKVKEEPALVDGVDFFEPGASERHADTPVVIARVFRGKQATRRLLVSAEESLDVNKRPLTFHWVVLRGDPNRISIKPDEKGTTAEIHISYHERRPIDPPAPGTAPDTILESNRVDIGVFAFNGKYYSAPSFVTYYFLDHEDRTYDNQRLLEIGYKAGDLETKVNDWVKLFALLRADSTGLPATLLKSQLKPDEIAGILTHADAYQTAALALTQAKDNQKLADEERNKVSKLLKEADDKKKAASRAAEQTPGEESKQALEKAGSEHAAAAARLKEVEEAAKAARTKAEAAQKTAADILAQKRDGLSVPIQTLIDGALARMIDEPGFYFARQADFEQFLATSETKPRAGALANARNRLELLGMLAGETGKWSFKSIRPEGAPTRFERSNLRRLHGELLTSVLYPGLIRSEFRVNYVPPELAEPPNWRDVYRYDSAGQEIGWTRYGDKTPAEFTWEGYRVLTHDAQGRPLTAQSVKYQPENPTQRSWPIWRNTLQLPGALIVRYAYAGEEDLRGKVVSKEAVPEKKPEEPKPEEKK